MLIEAYRIHPKLLDKYPEVEDWNNHNFVIHPLYQKKLIDVDFTKPLLVKEKYQVVEDGWFAKTVHEIIDLSDLEKPTIFIRRPLYLELKKRGVISREMVHQ